jgi:hypothetical protein
MREYIFKSCDLIHEGLTKSKENSSLFTARGDVDGDGFDEVVLSNAHGVVAIIKKSTVYLVSNHQQNDSVGSVCSLNICAITGDSKAEIITIGLTGSCIVYSIRDALIGRSTAAVNSKNSVILTVVVAQSGLKANSTAAKVFK